MKGIRDIKRRIKAVKNTAQITRAMQLVAASKMKRAQSQAISHRPYAFLFQEIVNSLRDSLGDITHPLLAHRPVKKTGILCISSNKGLCGSLNANLTRVLLDQPKESTYFICSGKKILQSLARAGRNIQADFEVPYPLNFQSVKTITNYLIGLFLDGTIDSIQIAYPGFVNTLIQQTVLEPIVPIINLEESLDALRKQYKLDQPHLPVSSALTLFEPSPQAILNELPLLFITQKIYHCFLESRAAEESARMVAMKTATDNAKNIIQDLALEYNKARQASITQEILEISACSLV